MSFVAHFIANLIGAPIAVALTGMVGIITGAIDKTWSAAVSVVLTLLIWLTLLGSWIWLIVRLIGLI